MSEFWNSAIVKKSRKPYRCAYCSRTIEVGTSYSRESGKWEGEMQDYALCIRCSELLDSNDPVWCSYDGELGNFHDNLMDSLFLDCPKCGKNLIADFNYIENKMKIEIECDDCGEKYTVDLSSDNLLKDKRNIL